MRTTTKFEMCSSFLGYIVYTEMIIVWNNTIEIVLIYVCVNCILDWLSFLQYSSHKLTTRKMI